MSHKTAKRLSLSSASERYRPLPTWKNIKNKWHSTEIGRRFSETLPRTDSMVSLCFRSLATFINDNNFEGFQSFLDSKQVQVDDRDENGCTALILASTKGRSNFVRELLVYGAEANTEDSDNWTSLLCAAKEGHADICLQLLEHNADIEHRDMGGWTALMWATYKGRLDVVNILLDRHADVNAHGNYHISSLLWAAGRGYVQIVESLLGNGAKINMGDKYGTTALIWACRKGHTDIVRMLLKAGANVDTAGMYSWTALLVATQGNFEEIVHLLLEHKPNVNALDKDGCSALTIACKDGYYEIATSLMNVGAYINIQDRSSDTNLIHAVKGGHRAVVEALLKKYADVDITGKDRKTAIYMAVEKGYVAIVKLLLNSNPDLEIATKDGDTPLLKAVRSRNSEIVQLLLDKKAKVTAADKKGDTALHIAMRARSKAIVEILLRNPKHSHLLYRPNRSGETPYNIDMNHQKTILGQIFGARRLNTNEDNENMLGYDLYSSALADILSEPCLSMPITVGLYAKWGSGKSFLLNKLRDEMKNFARQWVDPVFQFTLLLLVIILHAALIVGTIFGLSIKNWILGIVAGCGIIFLCYLFLALVWFAGKRYDWDWPYNFHVKLTKKMNNIKLILQILFCHPPGVSMDDVTSVQPIRFYFTDQTRVSSTTGGENSVVQMIGSLYDAIENDYGTVSTRLFRAFKPKPIKSSTWKWRKICCLPTIVIFEITFIFLLIGICALTVFLVRLNSGEFQNTNELEKLTLYVILITVAALLGIATLANLYTWSKMFRALFRSQRRHLQKSIAKLDTLKSEGFIQALKQEVNLMKDMVKCLDSLSSQQTRLVIVVDGLDSCEQDKVLLILDAVHMLFSDVNSPFIVILAIDPHVIAKAAEFSNSKRLFSESNIGGHSYLNNMVHLPFYLQNSGLRKVKVAQQTALQHRKNYATTSNEESSLSVTGRTLSARRLSSENALMSSTEKLKSVRKGSRKLKLSESVASSIGSNLNKIGGAQDLTKMLLTDDYFSDVNPRSMRRLMNVVYITGRLLKAFQVEFNWYRLASWINITEQWPFRTSWIIYQYDICEEALDDNTPLKVLYDKVRPHIPSLKETEPLLELDRDERKFDIFLTYHRSSLLVSDLKVFLPFTINLDPYLKKVIKEETQTFEDGGIIVTPSPRNLNLSGTTTTPWSNSPLEWNTQRVGPINRRIRSFSTTGPTAVVYPQSNVMNWRTWGEPMQSLSAPPHPHYPLAPVTNLSGEILDIKLSSLNVDGVCKLLDKIEDLNIPSVQDYVKIIKINNINGRVLLHCDLEELKKLLKMSFGDWEMFKVAIVSLREQELTTLLKQEDGKSLRFSKSNPQTVKKPERKLSITKSSVGGDEKIHSDKSKQSVMEKQVTLEDIMICGALQTLNEEACEDVLEEKDEAPEHENNDVPITFIVPPSPDQSSQQEVQQRECRSRTNSSSGMGETDFVILQSSPIGHLHWQPIGISVQGNTESISEHSSRCSSPLPSPSMERRRSNSIRLSNLKSADTSDGAHKKTKHVIINTDNNQTNKTATNEFKYSYKTPLLLQEHKNASSQTQVTTLSGKSTITAGGMKGTTTKRPVSLYFKHDAKGNKYSARIRSHSIDNTVSDVKEKRKCPSLEKLHKLREKFFLSSNDIRENPTDDDESTPLVSELSSPITISPDDRSSHSLSSSDPLSPYVNKTINQLDRPTTSANYKKINEQNKFDNKQISLKDNSLTQSYNLSSSSLDITLSRPRTMSECTDSSLSLLGSNFKLINTSNVSLHSKGSQSSCHLSRQDALESEEYLPDVYCDPSNKN